MKLKLSLATLAAIAVCVVAGPANASVDKNALNPQAGITKIADQANNLDAAQVGVAQCDEGNQQNSSQPASGWTLAPAVMNGFSDGKSAPQMQTTRFDTGQANAENVLSAKKAEMTMANASIGHDSVQFGSWATSTMTNQARAQHQQPASGYIKT